MRKNPHVNYGQVVRGCGPDANIGRKEGIISTRFIVRISSAVNILKTSTSWSPTDHVRLQEWFTSYVDWLLNNPIGKAESMSKNNHETFYYLQLSACLVLLDRTEEARKHLRNFFEGTFPQQIAPDGNQLYETKRTRPFHYMCFNLEALIFLADQAEDVGDIDAYEMCDRGIQRAVDFAIRFWREGKQEKNADLTELVYPVRAVMRKFGDPAGVYTSIISEAKASPTGAKIEGGKHELQKLWVS